MKYESKHEPIASPQTFTSRLLLHFLFSSLIIAGSLGIGVLGDHYIAGFPWVDSVLNASMILGGMGPVGELPTDAAKLFASAYALFSGLAFIGVSAIIIAPVVHRVLHAFHIDDDTDKKP